MNDQSYNPISNINPDLHQSFAEPKDLSYAACMNRDVTTEEIKEKLADFRVKVFKCAYDYNISGNGDGNMIDEDAEWVPLESTHPDFGRWDRSKYKDDNRSDFNRNYGEIVVYAWDTWDNNDFLKTVFARLDLSQAATVDSTATTEAVSNNKKRKAKDNNNMSDFVSTLNTLSMAELSGAQRAEEAQILDYEMKMFDFEEGSPPILLLKKMAAKAQARADLLGKEIRSLALKNITDMAGAA